MKKGLVGLCMLMLGVLLTACGGNAILTPTQTPELSIQVLPSWDEGKFFNREEKLTIEWTSMNPLGFITISLYKGESVVLQDVFFQEKDIQGLVSQVPPGGAYSYLLTIQDTGTYTWKIPSSLASGEYTLKVFIQKHPVPQSKTPSFVLR